LQGNCLGPTEALAADRERLEAEGREAEAAHRAVERRRADLEEEQAACPPVPGGPKGRGEFRETNGKGD